MKPKRVWALVTAFLMVLSLFAGCSGDSGIMNTSSMAESSSSSESSSSGAESSMQESSGLVEIDSSLSANIVVGGWPSGDDA